MNFNNERAKTEESFGCNYFLARAAKLQQWLEVIQLMIKNVFHQSAHNMMMEPITRTLSESNEMV